MCETWGYGMPPTLSSGSMPLNMALLVTKDADFHQRSFLYGHPPKVIWVRIGNGSTAMIEALLRRRVTEVAAFSSDRESAFLILD